MELQNSREYKAAQELERALNDMGWSPKRFAESTRFYHRTLQQELMRTIVAVIRMVGDDSYRTDLKYTLKSMADTLNKEGFVTSQGCSFSKSTVYKLIKRYNLKED